MDAQAVRDRVAGLPRESGVYQFVAGDRALYVGKAVDLRSRVRSYADPRSPRIRRMVEEATGLEVAVTDTETQALLLEANFIKRLQPQYNVLLTDDKSYPLVQLTDHPYPRIEVTRDPEEGATVYGPYTVRGRVDTVVKALRETFGVRGCSDHKFASRERPCLDYDIGLCTAPCTAEISRDDYLDDVGSVREFLEGATGVLADPLAAEMERAARERDFERAAHLRDRLEVVRGFHEGMGDAVDARREHRATDVLGAVVEGETAVVARLHAEGGQLVERERHRLKAPRSTRVPTALAAFIPQYYAERELPDRLLLSDHHGDDEIDAWLAREGVEVSVPGTGRESRLVDLALMNARLHVDDDEAGRLAEALGLGSVERIEGFDVSHAGGRSAVGSNVVFVGGTPEKAGYRRKRLSERNDDYANTAELLDWRARRAVEGRDDRPDPDLLLIDGGEGQLEAARGAVEAAGWDVPAVALAKEGEVVVTPEGRLAWPDDAPHLHLLQRVRDEAHRFAVQYHRHRRDDVSTVLDGVEGIGPDRRRRLLRRFGSVEGIRSASTAELRSVEGIGPTTAERLKRRL